MWIKRITAAAAMTAAAFGVTVAGGSAAQAADWHQSCNSWPSGWNYLPTNSCLWHANQNYQVGQRMYSSPDYNLQSRYIYGQNQYVLVLQPDGNLVEYSVDGFGYIKDVKFSSNTFTSSPGWLAMQSDGNLVAYDGDGRAYWWTGTNGQLNNTATLRITDRGTVYVTDGNSNYFVSPVLSPIIP